MLFKSRKGHPLFGGNVKKKHQFKTIVTPPPPLGGGGHPIRGFITFNLTLLGGDII